MLFKLPLHFLTILLDLHISFLELSIILLKLCIGLLKRYYVDGLRVIERLHQFIAG